MRTIAITFLLLAMTAGSLSAQKYLTKNGHIRFFSEAPLENIEADNHQVTSILDASTGEVVFSLLMKGFHFEKALMQEHFNEKYVHSDKYPKSTFRGMIEGLTEMPLDEAAGQRFWVKGTLDLHGIQKEITAEAELSMEDDKISASCVFPITLADYDISIPGVVKDNIAEIVEVTVNMQYEPYNK
jgi:polyisoprenoid-binding protein YceI